MSRESAERRTAKEEAQRWGACSAARHTFLGASGFRRWNGAAGKLCVSARALMEFQKRQNRKKEQNQKQTRETQKTFERSRLSGVRRGEGGGHKVHNETEASEEQLLKWRPVANSSEKQVGVKRFKKIICK